MARMPAGMGDIRLFALGPDAAFGAAVADAAGVEPAPYEERAFEDGEHKARPLVGVRGADVFVLDSLYGDAEHSTNDKLCRMLFFLGALRDAGAASTTAVLPYLCYTRKDRRTRARDPVTTRYVAALFEAVGTDAVLTVDVHNLAAYQNAFRLRTEHLEARPLFVRWLAGQIGADPITVVSPDAGGVKRADALRQSLAAALEREVELAFIEKHRSDGSVRGDGVAGALEGRSAVIVDDLIASGTTIVRAARACVDRGSLRVWALATHGLFTAGAADALADPAIGRLVVLNTIPPVRLAAAPLATKLTVLNAAPLLGEAIRRLHAGGSLDALLEDRGGS